ncbi:MAG TPA: porin PorA family protein [Candidatus Limnocylindrales bacterium]|nr:porin PorA family protein [Candidatus Limnocylindrales bacterium]
MRKGALFLTAGAVILVAAAAAARYYVLPMVHQVPSDVDNTLKYTGTVSMINPTAMASGDTSKMFLTNVAVTAEQRVKAVQVSGRTVVMSSDTSVKGPDGAAILTSNHVFALDRVTLEAATPPTGNSNVEPHTGLALGFPLTPEKKDYQYWDTTTQTAVPAKYSEDDVRGGRDTYVYRVHAEGAIKDAKIQAMLPQTLPKAILPLLANALPPAIQQALAQFLPGLPESMPLTYTSITDTTFWVDKKTGIVIDVDQQQVIKAQLGGVLAAAPLPAAFDLSLKSTDDTVKASASDAAEAENGLMLIGTYVPIGLAGLGALLFLVAIILAVRRRRPRNEITDQTTEQA